MKTLKPMQLSVLHRCFEHRGEKLLGISVLAFLPLCEDPALLLEPELWPFLGEALGPDAAFEQGIPKAVSEYLVVGAAYPPGQEPVEAMAVGVRFGSSTKSLLVHGDRYWDDRLPTAAKPFASLPLSWSNTYGGAGFDANPVGRGHPEADATQRKRRALPNIEYPGEEVRSQNDVGRPAGFGPIDITWPQRAKLVGTYDQAWLKTLFPGLAADIDWRHFNVAPSDQWLNRPIAPDEAYELVHLHPTRHRIEGRLPGVVARAFVNRRLNDDGLNFEEVPLALRTVAFFPDRERVVLVYQGELRIADEHAADIVHLLVGADAQGQPRPAAAYREVLERRLDKEEGAFHALNDADLTPTGIRLATLGGGMVPSDDPALERALRRAEDEVTKARALVSSHGLDPDKHAPSVPVRDTAVLPPLGDFNHFIQTQLAEAQALGSKHWQWAREQDQSIASTMKLAGQDFALILKERTEGQSGPPAFSAQEQLDSLRELSQRMRAMGAPVAELDDYVGDAKFGARLGYAEEQIRGAYRLTAHHQPAAPQRGADDSARLKTQLAADHAAGLSLAGRELVGADLRGLDLRGADLSGAVLEGADLSGVDFTDCRLANAVLTRATLHGAKLDRCDLSGANLGAALLRDASLAGALLHEAILAGADLARTSFVGAQLAGADFAGAQFHQTDFSQVAAPDMVFIEVDFSGAIFRSAVMTKNVFVRCRFTDIDLSGADLSGSAFVEASAWRACFAGARLERCCFVAPTVLSEADFDRAQMSSANLRDADLRGARFESAVLCAADLSNARLAGAFLYQADARQARFVTTDLSLAVLANANLMDAVLERAILRGADLRQANLFQADLARVKLDSDTRSDGSLKKRARIFPRLTPQEMAL